MDPVKKKERGFSLKNNLPNAPRQDKWKDHIDPSTIKDNILFYYPRMRDITSAEEQKEIEENTTMGDLIDIDSNNINLLGAENIRELRFTRFLIPEARPAQTKTVKKFGKVKLGDLYALKYLFRVHPKTCEKWILSVEEALSLKEGDDIVLTSPSGEKRTIGTLCCITDCTHYAKVTDNLLKGFLEDE